MTRLKYKIPILCFAIANSIFINLSGSSDIIIISLLLFMAGYLIYKVYDIFDIATDGYLSLDSFSFIITILALCIYSTAVTVINIGLTAYIYLAILNIISGHYTAYLKYSYFDDGETWEYDPEEENEDDATNCKEDDND